MMLTVGYMENFRNPRRWFRVLAAAFACAMPGILAGGIVSVFFGRPTVCFLLGLAIGALCGAWFEGHSSSR
jgi:hypothetical protein